MGYRELLEAIREEGEKKIKDLWNEAKAKAEIIRKERDSKLEELKREYADMFKAVVEERKNRILRDAEREASMIRLKAQEDLSRRLFNISLRLLHDLRRLGCGLDLAAIAKEIPYSNWVTARVNPEDVTAAKSLFPEAEVISDPSIIGGLVVVSSDGNVITNTLEKRLERLWPEILPEIMKTIKKMYGTPNR